MLGTLEVDGDDDEDGIELGALLDVGLEDVEGEVDGTLDNDGASV